MSLHLLGPEGHPSWASVASSFDHAAPLATPELLVPGDRVVLWASYEDLGHLDATLAELVPQLASCDVLLVAPDLDPERPLGQAIARAEALLPHASVLLHAPPIESVLAAWDDVRNTRTLSLPLPDEPLPLVAWRGVAEAIIAWTASGEPRVRRHLGGPESIDGPALARATAALLDRALEPEAFVAARLRELDENGDGVITTEEAARFLVGLGHPPSTAARIIADADLDGDGTLSVDEFRFGLGDQLGAALAALPRDVQWHRDLPHLMRERWVGLGRPHGYAHALTEHLAYSRSRHAAPDARGQTPLGAVLGPHALALVDVFILPGRGLLARSEGRFGEARPNAPELLWRKGDEQLDHPASFTQLSTVDGQHLDTRKSSRGALEARWRNITATERLRYGQGDEARALELADGRLVGVACRGPWSGLRDTMTDLMERRPIRAWERALFQELGALHLEHIEDVVDPQEVICNCIGVKRQTSSPPPMPAPRRSRPCATRRARPACVGVARRWSRRSSGRRAWPWPRSCASSGMAPTSRP